MAKKQYQFNTHSLKYEEVKPKLFTWSRVAQFLIVLFGLVGSAITIYVFFQDKKVLIEYEILSNTNVLDINADITKLDITYGGLSLKSRNENLRIINLRVKNNGTESILKNFYDDHDPIGLNVVKGTIIEKPELINTSNDYLKNNLQIKFDSTGKITFNDIIIEPSQFFTIKILVLHSSKVNPNLVSFGKIAGQNEIPVVSFIQQTKVQKPFLEETFGGNFWSQLLRGVAYTLVVLTIVLGIIYFTSEISDYRAKRKRIRIVKRFRKSKGYNYNHMDDVIFGRFINEDYDFSRFMRLLADRNSLNESYKNILLKIKERDERYAKGEIIDEESIENKIYFRQESSKDDIDKMIGDGYLIKDNDSLVINESMKKSLIKFLEYLNDIDYVKKYRIKL